MKKKTKAVIQKKCHQLKEFIKKVLEILKRPEMAILPGQLAFFLILSLVPIITILGYSASYFNISMNFIVDAIKANFPETVAQMIVPMISGETLDTKLILILIIMYYIASNGAASIIITANQIYGIKQSSYIKRRAKALLLTSVIVILYLFIILVPILGGKIIDAVDYFNIKSILSSIVEILQGPISWIIIFTFIKIIFTFAPDKNIPSGRINIGALFTTIGWIAATEIYGYYSSHFATRYDLFYAGLSNIAVLMLWIYLLSYILVIGLSLTTKIDKEDLEELEKTGTINITN